MYQLTYLQSMDPSCNELTPLMAVKVSKHCHNFTQNQVLAVAESWCTDGDYHVKTIFNDSTQCLANLA